MSPLADMTGVILAGGKSSRFGSNKALAMVDSKPLLQHVADLMSNMFSQCLLVTNTPAEYEFLSLPMTHDRYREMGPLAAPRGPLLSLVTCPVCPRYLSGIYAALMARNTML